MSQLIRQAAIAVVEAEERANGWSPSVIGVAALEKQYGCDILSVPPYGGPPHPVEVKGWGEPFLRTSGKFVYPQDVRQSQMVIAKQNPNFRVEIVANLTASARHRAI